MPLSFTSATRSIPTAPRIPRHIAIIMDGNGRWAKQRLLPRLAGHQQGRHAVRAVVRACVEQNVEYLTLFAFSSENWRRPGEEVSFLMGLFLKVLKQEVAQLHKQGVCLHVIGQRQGFSTQLQQAIAAAEAKTTGNTRLHLTIAVDYGGRWDVLQAFQSLLRAQPTLAATPEAIHEEQLTPYLSMAYAPEPDLFIRTGGEARMSNFLLWQMAYTELYFTDTYWPDFDAHCFAEAIASYQRRERRFGRTSDQLTTQRTASPGRTASLSQAALKETAAK